MIRLYQFPPIWGLPNTSTFCLKVECYLKLSNVPYEIKKTINSHKAPKSKLPYIQDLENHQIIADSSFIIDYLNKKYDNTLDALAQLTLEQRAASIAFQRLIEEHLYWFLVYERWCDQKGWKIVKPAFFKSMGFPFKYFIPNLIRKYLIKACNYQGIGRFSFEERASLCKKDIDAMVSLLGDKSFLWGNTPTSLDCSWWAVLTNVLNTPVSSILKSYMSTFPNLIEYDKRMHNLFHSSHSIDK